MNKKVFVSMLSLCVAYLVGSYILKIFFPQEFVMSMDNERIVAIGTYIDTHKWASIIFGVVIGIVFDWFYFGAVTRKLIPHYTNIIIMVAYNLGLAIYYNFAPTDIIIAYSAIITGISSCYMIVTPMFFTRRIKELSITYGINAISQVLLLSIRSLSMASASGNSLSIFIMSIDNYLWIALCFIIFNYEKIKKEI